MSLVPALALAQQAVRFDDIVDQLDRVSIRARRAGGTCREQVSGRIVELADRLDAQRSSRPRGLSRVMDDVSELHAEASYQRCPDDVLDGLLVTIDLVSDARGAMFADRRDEDAAVAQLAPLQVQLDQGVRVAVRELTLRGIKGQAFSLVLRVRTADGPWSELERTQRWSVPADPFVWRNAWAFSVPAQKLPAGEGRFIARVSVVDDQQRELGYREARFSVGAAAAPTARDCGTGVDLGCTQSRGGVFAIERPAFTAALAQVGAEKNDQKRVKVAKSAFSTAFLTAAQLTLVLDLFPEKEALEVATMLLGRVVNPGDAAVYAARFQSVELRTRFQNLVKLQVNPNLQPRAYRVEGQMDRRSFTFEGPTRDAINDQCRRWKDGDITTQGFIMRLSISGGRTRSDMLNTDGACGAVAGAATPLY